MRRFSPIQYGHSPCTFLERPGRNMTTDICAHTSWDELEARWICELDGFDCTGRPESWGERCPGTRATDTPCPNCLNLLQRTQTPRFIRMDTPNLNGLFCTRCGYAASPRDCAADLIGGHTPSREPLREGKRSPRHAGPAAGNARPYAGPGGHGAAGRTASAADPVPSAVPEPGRDRS